MRSFAPWSLGRVTLQGALRFDHAWSYTPAETIPATIARDHYLLSMTNAREHRYPQAVTHLNEAVRINPRDYWSWMQRGLCHQEMGDTA